MHIVHDHFYVYRIKKHVVNVHKGSVNLYNLETKQAFRGIALILLP